ncbi:unnamed protein product, partial [Mesorhabditis belari]|uniref:Uracil-DNA glycosylase n=1 Tax=Mesorhabditis belari TaxID=2138241 RepID=A0AAF3FNP4_9BILA
MKKVLSLKQGANLLTCEGSSGKGGTRVGAIDESKMATTTPAETSVTKEKPKDVFPMFKKAVKRPASVNVEEAVKRPARVDVEEFFKRPAGVDVEESVKRPASVAFEEAVKRPASVDVEEAVKRPASVDVEEAVKGPASVDVEEAVKRPASADVEESVKRPASVAFEKAVKRPMMEDGENMPPTSSTTFTLINYLKEPQWKAGLSNEFKAPYMKKIEEFLQKQYKMQIIVRPPKDEIFNAFNLTPLNKVKVVILGQDPYHDTNQAHGLSFSVKKGVAIPPSLVNIYKELAADIEGFNIPKHGNLLGWATQGVFMLNAALSVEVHKANSHSQIGWHTFTDKVIQFISKNVKHCVFLLWGAYAQKKVELIDRKRHTVIMTAHPSPLSCHRGFTGSRCFSRANQALKDHGMKPIDWNNLP